MRKRMPKMRRLLLILDRSGAPLARRERSNGLSRPRGHLPCSSFLTAPCHAVAVQTVECEARCDVRKKIRYDTMHLAVAYQIGQELGLAACRRGSDPRDDAC